MRGEFIFIAIVCVVFVVLVLMMLWSFIPSRTGSSPKFEVQKPYCVVLMEKDNIGNQMFQLAHAFAIGKLTNRNVILRGPKLKRPLILQAAKELDVSIETVDSYPQPKKSEQTISENGFAFTPLKIGKNLEGKNLNIAGYFQSELYFQYVRSNIRKAFGPKPALRTQLRNALAVTKESKVIGVHIRGGDYTKFAHYHTNLPLKYYVTGVNKLMNDISDLKRIVIFSDSNFEAKRLQKELKSKIEKHLLSKTQIVLANDILPPKRAPEVDIWSMASCDGLVAANSSFSWWGGWLGSQSSSVVLPNQWFDLAGPKDFKDVLLMSGRRLHIVDVKPDQPVFSSFGVKQIVLKSNFSNALSIESKKQFSILGNLKLHEVIPEEFDLSEVTGSLLKGKQANPVLLYDPKDSKKLKWRVSSASLQCMLERFQNVGFPDKLNIGGGLYLCSSLTKNTEPTDLSTLAAVSQS